MQVGWHASLQALRASLHLWTQRENSRPASDARLTTEGVSTAASARTPRILNPPRAYFGIQPLLAHQSRNETQVSSNVPRLSYLSRVNQVHRTQSCIPVQGPVSFTQGTT